MRDSDREDHKSDGESENAVAEGKHSAKGRLWFTQDGWLIAGGHSRRRGFRHHAPPLPLLSSRISEKCAWQESNLLPFGPEPNALSGELQAREDLCSLNCALRAPAHRDPRSERACCMPVRHASCIQSAAAQPDAIQFPDLGHPAIGRHPVGIEGMPWVWPDRRLHHKPRPFRAGARGESRHAVAAAGRRRGNRRSNRAVHGQPRRLQCGAGSDLKRQVDHQLRRDLRRLGPGGSSMGLRRFRFCTSRPGGNSSRRRPWNRYRSWPQLLDLRPFKHPVGGLAQIGFRSARGGQQPRRGRVQSRHGCNRCSPKLNHSRL